MNAILSVQCHVKLTRHVCFIAVLLKYYCCCLEIFSIIIVRKWTFSKMSVTQCYFSYKNTWYHIVQNRMIGWK